MRVYLDNCSYNRPFDEQTQLNVRLETEAKPLEYVQEEVGAQDYTRWREANMYVGESVHDVFDERNMDGE